MLFGICNSAFQLAIVLPVLLLCFLTFLTLLAPLGHCMKYLCCRIDRDGDVLTFCQKISFLLQHGWKLLFVSLKISSGLTLTNVEQHSQTAVVGLSTLSPVTPTPCPPPPDRMVSQTCIVETSEWCKWHFQILMYQWFAARLTANILSWWLDDIIFHETLLMCQNTWLCRISHSFFMRHHNPKPCYLN